MSRCLRLFAVVCLLASAFVRADEWTPTRSFRTFSKSSWRGLPQSSVMALAQSSDGVLWIGTLDGVASFDGKSITPVPATSGAPLRGIITTIIPRKAGGVFVASQAGVHIFDGTNWRLVPTKRGAASLAESRDGVLWLIDGGNTLFTLAANDTWQQRSEVANGIALSAASDGAIWVATPNGAARIKDGRVEQVDGLQSRPGAILAASDGKIWIGTQNCTVHWTSGIGDSWHQVAFTPWSRGAIRCLSEDRRARIWAGSAGGHVAFGTATTPWTVWGVAHGPFEAGVMSVLGDREGSVWFGLNAVGLVQWIGEAWSHRPMADPANPSRALFSAFGLNRPANLRGLLVSAFNTGAIHLTPDGTIRRFFESEGLTEDVRAFAEPEPGKYICGTRFGIFESSDAGKSFHQTLKLANGFVMGLFKSPDERWYAASSTEGVFVRDGNAWKPVDAINSHLENKHVRGMMWRANGELWVATLRGISIYNGDVFQGQLSSRTEPAIPDSVNAVLEVSDDEIWAAGTGGIAIRKNAKWQRMGDAAGIPGQTIYSLARAKDGAIWAGGSAGVGKFADGKWTVWDSRSGLLQEECNLNGLVIDDDGSVYVGTMSGLARYDPTVKKLTPPKLTLSWRNVPNLANGDRALHLRWSAPWLDPHPVQYRVRVPRLRDEWSAPTTDDRLDVENLSAGDWRVEVEARVEGTNEWSAPLALDVNVPPFWYETWPARLAAIALLALLIYGAVRLRLRALRKHAEMLEATVRERTAELAESEQRALAASRAKSAFLANMSHELRTPLNGVLGFAQLMARRKDRDAEDQQGLAVIMSSGEHLLGLINDVLSLSKIEAGRITLEQSRFDLRNVVRDVENVLRIRAEEKQLKFTSEVDELLPHAVMGDEVRVRQILLNLVGNAVKFTEAGSVRLRVTWRDDVARFEVEDTGPGISEIELPKLFEPFVQSETGQRTREGTGLGLALSRNLARLMNGDITVQSKRGFGSTFTAVVTLPEAIVEESSADGQHIARLAPEFEGTRILVVDDTAINRLVLTTLLSKVGFDVREASNGDDAIALWETWKPQLIWMDKRMTPIDGLETTRRIRAREKLSGAAHTPILALSASALEHERGEILAAGCDDFVAKPFLERTIFAKIRDHIGVAYEYDGGGGRPRPPMEERADEGVRPHNVLLVDDDWICREVATEILRGNGVGVTAASSGQQALELLESSRFDLVLMDLHMPDMGGVETTRRIRANPATAKLPIIAMSADTFDGESARLAQAGMNDHVGKPVEPAALTDVVQRWLR